MKGSNTWMSVSDLMTGLMVIFLFVAISYIRKVQENQNVLVDYVETKNRLHDKLVNEFEGDTAKWQMTIGRDLSMKFNNPEVLFASGKADLTVEFKDILDEFLPKYFSILLNDSLRSSIKEIRIEGHADDNPIESLHRDSYIANAMLSQERALSVLEYFREMEVFRTYDESERRLLEFWFTANGLSFGKSLDANGEYTIKSGREIDKQLSRRVEIRIVTSGDDVLIDFVKQLNN